MLLADPSSHCDICCNTFGEGRECYSIPCGHIFCLLCLGQLPRNHFVCPMCRTPVQSQSRIRKINVDWSTEGGPSNIPLTSGGQPTRVVVERELLEQLASEAERGISLTRAIQLQQKIQDFVKRQPDDEHIVLKSFASVLCNLYQTKDLLEFQKQRYEDLEYENIRLSQCERDLRMERNMAVMANSCNENIIRILSKEVTAYQEAEDERRDTHQQPNPHFGPHRPENTHRACPTSSRHPAHPHAHRERDIKEFTTRGVTHTMPQPRSTLPETFEKSPWSRTQAAFPSQMRPPDYPPPPPMPTVHVPEIGEEIRPHQAALRTRQNMSNAAEVRPAREWVRSPPTLSYETVYREQMQSRVRGNAHLPELMQPKPTFYGETHMPNKRNSYHPSYCPYIENPIPSSTFISMPPIKY